MEKLEQINAGALAACDANDGVEDGLIENPATCDFDPATLQCAGDDAPDCLTAAQVDSVQKIYEGLPDPTTGELWYPGFERGSELGWPGDITDPLSIVEDCQEGMRRVGERYEQRQYFLSGLIMAGEIFREVMELVQPVIKEKVRGNGSGRILLGTVQGDIHDVNNPATAHARADLILAWWSNRIALPPRNGFCFAQLWINTKLDAIALQA